MTLTPPNPVLTLALISQRWQLQFHHKISVKIHIITKKKNKTEDPSVPYAGQGYIRVLNVIEIIKSLKNAKLN